MNELILAVVVFLATHALPALKPLRAALVARLGSRAYVTLYSILTVAVLIWLGVAYARAPYVEVWAYRPELRWVPILVMPFACILLVASLSTANPLSAAPGRLEFDPTRPGIVSVTRHPLMWAFALWAGAHIVPNGDVASLILFGLLLILALAGLPSLDAKRRAALGAAEWARRAAATSSVPLAAVVAGRTRLDLAGIGVARIVGGLVLYAAMLFGHEALIGIAVWPV